MRHGRVAAVLYRLPPQMEVITNDVEANEDFRGTDAFDVIGELTFSKPLGFLEQGRDIDGIIKALAKMLDYAGKVCLPAVAIFLITLWAICFE